MPTSSVLGISMSLRIEGSTVAENQDYTLTLNQTNVDVTSRDSDYWRELLTSTRDWSIDGSGLYISSNVAKKVLMNHYSARSPESLTVVLTLADGTITVSGEAYLSSLNMAGPHADPATWTFTLEGTSTLTVSVS